MARELTGRRFWLHALGGGTGHAVRGATLALELEQHGVPALLAVPRELGPLVRALGVERVSLHAPERDAQALASVMRKALLEEAITDFVADVFPEGVIGELDALFAKTCQNMRRVALLRVRSDAGTSAFRAALARFDRVLDLEPHLAWLPAATRAEPARPFTRALVTPEHAEHSEIDVRVIASEARLEACFGALAARLRARGLRTELVRATHPRGHLFSTAELAARVVVGPAGYNLTYELERIGAWHVAVPLSRRFDVQARRARAVAEACFSPDAVERRVLALLTGAQRRGPPRYAEHARSVVSRLLE